jgi:hypothetical protein
MCRWGYPPRIGSEFDVSRGSVDRPGIGKKSEKNDVSGELRKSAWGGVKTVEIVKTQKMAENVKKTRIVGTPPPPPFWGRIRTIRGGVEN